MIRTSFLLSLLGVVFLAHYAGAEPLAGTQPLSAEGDLAAQMVAGIDKYLMRELAASVEKRKAHWKPDFSSPEAYAKSVEPNRERLRKILGVIDKRVPFTELEYVSTTSTPALVAEGDGYKVYAVRWPVFNGVDAEGLLLEPKSKPVACVVAIPDADWFPEMLVGLAPGVPKESQFARRLAENRCRVLVPTLIDRKDTWSGNPKLGRMTNLPHREYIYRMAYELGRHIVGYEVQKVLAAVDWFCQEKEHPRIGVIGYGEGGMLALYAAALDTRFQLAAVDGYFGPREAMWQEPIYRNVWGRLSEFGDAEVAMLIVPRPLLIGRSPGPEIAGPPTPHDNHGSGAAPGALRAIRSDIVKKEKRRLTSTLNRFRTVEERQRADLESEFLGSIAEEFLDVLLGHSERRSSAVPLLAPESIPHVERKIDPVPRLHRQFDQLVNYTQHLLPDVEARRKEFFWSKLDTSSLEKYEASTKKFRDYFWEEVIGKLPAPAEPVNPRTREAYDTPKWKGYEVTLDLYPDVFAYGILLVPKDLKEGERRPVVVCQHGLEGRPQDVVNPTKKTPYYNSFGAQLADRGYIVYAPQNPYIGQDLFRVLQRKANPLKLSLFSFIVRQHERTLDWLSQLPFVDKERIAFYGLSYGGKTAMRVPAILERYCLSICSGDFNEWVWKNVSTELRVSYVFSGEYEMFEFDLGQTFNYAEMAALIAPRPFMVERGHDDPVGIDEWVSYEFAKVRYLYSKLKIPERTAIEYFAGGHMINGKGTFEFLDKHLKWQPK